MPAGIKKSLANFWLQLFFGFLLLEIVSFLVFPYAWLSRLAFVLILIIAGVLTARKSEYGVYLLLAELVVGGFGYLISYPYDGGRISLRLGLFAAVFIIWLVKFLLKRDFSKLRDWRLIPLAVFFVFFCWAIIRGFLNGHGLGLIFSDFNGYLYFALFGLFLTANVRPMKLAQVLLVGSLMFGLKTLAILLIFSHGLALVNHSFIYTWIRDIGVGEITLISAPLFRIFFQSQIYNLLALIFSVFILLVGKSEAGDSHAAINAVNQSRSARLLLWFVAWFNFFVLVVSQSRSFWVAGLMILIFAVPAVAFYFRISWQRILVYVFLLPAFAIVSNFAGQIIIGDFQTNFFTGRVGGEAGSAGISSRMAELAPAFALIRQAPLLGNGFGATIRFRSDDPRIKNQSNPEGWTDAVAIEWGYLDLAIKTGLLGLFAYLAFLLCLFWSLFKQAVQRDLLVAGLLCGLSALMIVHIFTPYLNHPLGIGYLLAIMALTKKSA